MVKPIVSVEVFGIPGAKRALKRWGVKSRGAIQDGLLKSSQFLQHEVIQSIKGARAEPKSVDTGRFKASVQYSRPSILRAAISVFSNVRYASWLEYGTRHDARASGLVTLQTGPRRHFRNSLQRNKGRIRTIFKQRLAIGLKL